MMPFNYQSKKWKRFCVRLKRIAELKCTCCSNQFAERDLRVHHLKDADLYPALSYDMENLVVCCSDCHEKIHHRSPAGTIKPLIESVPMQCDWVGYPLKTLNQMARIDMASRGARIDAETAERITMHSHQYDRDRRLAEENERRLLQRRDTEQFGGLGMPATTPETEKSYGGFAETSGSRGRRPA